jgi:hypothetical protein
MSRTVANVLRVATIVVFAAVAVLAYRTFTPSEPITVPEPRAGELPVDRAISVAVDRPLSVRGYVFDGPGGLGLRLCHGRKNTSPPGCRGPFLDLDRVNRGSFDLRSGTTDDGTVRWTGDPLTLRGTILGTRMTVTEVLR